MTCAEQPAHLCCLGGHRFMSFPECFLDSWEEGHCSFWHINKCQLWWWQNWNLDHDLYLLPLLMSKIQGNTTIYWACSIQVFQTDVFQTLRFRLCWSRRCCPPLLLGGNCPVIHKVFLRVASWSKRILPTPLDYCIHICDNVSVLLLFILSLIFFM